MMVPIQTRQRLLRWPMVRLIYATAGKAAQQPT